MLIILTLSKQVEPVGDCATFYIDTENKYFIEEVQKYKCPFRLARFLDDAKEQFDDIKELIRLEPSHKIDLFIDLTHIAQEIIEDIDSSPFGDLYLEQTKHLDKYGYEKDTIEESDLTENSDSAYEMQLDDIIYKN